MIRGLIRKVAFIVRRNLSQTAIKKKGDKKEDLQKDYRFAASEKEKELVVRGRRGVACYVNWSDRDKEQEHEQETVPAGPFSLSSFDWLAHKKS